VFRLVEVLVLVHKQLILPWDSHFEQTIDESRWSSLRDIATIHGKDDVAALLQVELVPRPRPVPSRAERRDTGWLQALLCGWMDSFDLPFSRVKTLHVEFLVHGRHREVDGETYDTQVRTKKYVHKRVESRRRVRRKESEKETFTGECVSETRARCRVVL
jgi:hypothetical protein